MNDIAMNEEKIFLESLEQLVELAKSKKNMLEISDIDKFLKDKSISAEHISVSGGEKDRCSSEYGRSFFGRR